MKTRALKDKLREMNAAELGEKLKNSKEELFNLRFRLATGHLEDVSSIRRVKKEIARVHTILTEKEGGTR